MSENAPRRAVVILAAGASSRMQRPKTELLFSPFGDDAYTFLSRAIDLALWGCSSGPIVVVGRIQAPEPAASDRVAWVVNPHPERGMFSSVQIALRVVSDAEGPPDHTLVLLVDHPLVQRATVSRLWELAEREPDAIVRPVYAGRPGHPVVLPPEAVRRALEAEADARLDHLIDGLEVCELRVGDAGVVRDIDTPEHYTFFFGPLG